MSTPTPPPSRHALVLAGVLRVLRPLVRLLLRHGLTFPELVQALKPVFLAEARDELAQRGMAATDSALSLLSGLHRKDVRALGRDDAARAPRLGGLSTPVSLSGEVVARWLGDPAWQTPDGLPRPLDRAAFDTLAAAVSQDVRPRALLDELQRLEVVTADAEGRLVLARQGFAPRAGLAEMTELMAANLGDHAAAAVANLQGEENFLEQALFVDRLLPESVPQLRQAARQAWQHALAEVLREARARFDHDQAIDRPGSPRQRARFGVYFYATEDSPR